MKKNPETCYMCDLPAVEGKGEHVPPRCFFPKSKDLQEGQDLRKNLYTVPSCNAHNCEKSKEDQYFLNVVTSSELLNDIGRNHYRNQIRRQNQRNPSIIARFADRAMEENGKFGHEIEIARFDSIINHFARAFYFLHFKQKWLVEVRWFPEFMARPSGSEEESDRLAQIKLNEANFKNVPFHGENPDAFKYQIFESPLMVQARIHFYEGCRILLIFPKLTDDHAKHNKAIKYARKLAPFMAALSKSTTLSTKREGI